MSKLTLPLVSSLIATSCVTDVDRYACRRCGRTLFRADEVEQRRPLWDLGEERNEVFVLKSASGLGNLRRYDTSLHQGWYCCRFALMRMTTDKFGTGDALLAYVQDVERVPTGQPPRPSGDVHRGQTQLSADDLDTVLGEDRGDHLSVLKLSATWCPPCRLMDTVIARIDAERRLPDVQFFEADVDANPALAERFAVRSLPTLRFWYRGQEIEIEGGLEGGLSQQSLVAVSQAVLDAARSGARRVALR